MVIPWDHPELEAKQESIPPDVGGELHDFFKALVLLSFFFLVIEYNFLPINALHDLEKHTSELYS